MRKDVEVRMLQIYLSENSDTDVLTTGFIDERVQLLRWKWSEKRQQRGTVLKCDVAVHLLKPSCF